MSTLAGNSLSFAINIGAKDTTQGTLRSAARRFLSFARSVSKPITVPLRIGRKGLGILRDINVGLRPIVAGLDNIIERGTGLEVVRKSFESLTGESGRRADRLASRMTKAASGTLRLGRAMQIANRAMASGIQFDQLLIAMDFVSKKAITTGMSAEMAIEKVITGLSRGSTLFLDDFGILVDGLEGVKRTYNAVQGKGAFDSLGPAAQKAETIRQAIAEMGGQLDRIGVTGKETVFTFKALKNEIGDAVDKLFLAIGRSDALKGALQGVRDMFSGLVQHFEKGGSIGDVLFGKQGGGSSGLLGLLGAGVLDIGEFLGRGILAGLLKGMAAISDLFGRAWDAIGPKLEAMWDKLAGKIEGALKPLTDALAPIAKWLGQKMGAASKAAKEVADAIAKADLSAGDFTTAGSLYLDLNKKALSALWRKLTGEDEPVPPPPPIPPGVGIGFGPTIGFGRGAPKTGAAAWFDEARGKVLSGGVLGGNSRFLERWPRFMGDFPPSPKVGDQDDRFNLDAASFPLSGGNILKKRGEIRRLNLQIRRLDRTDGLLRREAHQQTSREMRRLREAGRNVKGARPAIFEEMVRRLMKSRDKERDRLIGVRDKLAGELDKSTANRERLVRGNLARDPMDDIWRRSQDEWRFRHGMDGTPPPPGWRQGVGGPTKKGSQEEQAKAGAPKATIEAPIMQLGTECIELLRSMASADGNMRQRSAEYAEKVVKATERSAAASERFDQLASEIREALSGAIKALTGAEGRIKAAGRP